MTKQATCQGCGAPFCAKGCNYCGRGEVNGEMVEVRFGGGMVFQNPMSSVRISQIQAQQNAMANHIGISRMRNSRSRNFGGLPLAVWCGLFA